jgi:hypothetical protein
MISYLLNPARKHKKSRKAKHRRGVARKHTRRISRKARRAGVKRRPYYLFTRPTKKYAKRVKRAFNPRRRRGSKRRRSNSRGWYFKRSRGAKRRRINPGLGGVGKMLAPAANLLPIRIPLPGILGTIANGTVQGVAIGVAAFAGYVGSGYLVDALASKAKVATFQSTLARNWTRPALFAATAGLVGGLVAMLAPKGRKAAWALAASAGPGIRAASGVLANLIPATASGTMAGVRNVAAGLADYLQVGAMYEAGLGEEEEGVDDFLQVGEMYEAGLGEEEEAEVVD